jgi:hypothetical protein
MNKVLNKKATEYRVETKVLYLNLEDLASLSEHFGFDKDRVRVRLHGPDSSLSVQFLQETTCL